MNASVGAGKYQNFQQHGQDWRCKTAGTGEREHRAEAGGKAGLRLTRALPAQQRDTLNVCNGLAAVAVAPG